MTRKEIVCLAGFVLVLGMIGMLASQRPHPRIIAAERFEVRDQDGVLRGWFGVEHGGTLLGLYDDEQRRHIELHVRDKGAIDIRIGDPDGATIALGISSHGLAGIDVSSRTAGTSLYADPDGSCRLTLRDRLSEPRAQLIVTPDGWPKIEFTYPDPVSRDDE